MVQLRDLKSEGLFASGGGGLAKQSIDQPLPHKNVEECAAYWKQQFIGLDSARFLLVLGSTHEPQADETHDYLIQGITLTPDSLARSVLLRAAWATLLSRRSGSFDTVFGSFVSRDNILPIRVIVDENMTVGELVRQVQHQAMEMVPFEKMSLKDIQASCEEAERGCQFQTLLAEKSDAQIDLPNTYTIAMANHMEDAGLRLHLRFDSKLISKCEIERLLCQLELILKQLSQPDMTSTKLGELRVASDHDLSTIWKWNTTVPESVDMCVHQVFTERVWDNSASPAVCAWDGDLTYGQLDKLSTKLSYHLTTRGVREGSIVPICIEKSMWMPVATLAVMKCGGASVLVDISQPNERIRSIMEQLSPKLILSSTSTEELAGTVSDVPVVLVSEASLKRYQREADIPVTPLSPILSSSPLYIIFTSGSTGRPKGAIVTHNNFCSAMKHHQKTLGFTSTSRVFDFTSYAFDVAWTNMLHTLTTGGCLCIPSNEDRSSAAGVANSIVNLRANYLHITPTVGRMLEPSELPDLETLIFGGETLKWTDVSRWDSTKIQIINTYGPAECTVTSTGQAIDPLSDKVTDPSIGKGLGTVTWIVKPDGTALAAVGTIGELWIEGPLVGGGYWNDPDKTNAAFVENPEWLVQGLPALEIPGRTGLLYKTGDLVRYDTNGSITFIGRRDTQVKIHGQRVELGEIEHHARQLLPAEVKQLVAEVVTLKGAETQTLALFFTLPDTDENVLEENAARLITALQEELMHRVATYMIPTAYFPLTEFPMTATGKTDRKALRQIGSSTEQHALFARKRVAAKWVEPSTTTERKLRSMWACVLNLKVSQVGIADSFLRLGGDSILAMKLVAAAREEGFFLSVQDIFKQPKLQQLAELIDSKEPTRKIQEAPLPLSLLRGGTDIDEARKSAADILSVNVADVEDIFPCTPLQEGLMAMTAMSADKYVSRSLVEILPSIDAVKLQEAWELVSSAAPILRTRMIDLPGQGLVQVVLRQQLPWKKCDSLEEYRLQEYNSEIGNGMSLGTELTRFGVVHDKPNNKTYLSWAQHHAVYDGWSLQLLQDAVEQAYFGLSVKPMASLQSMIQHLLQLNKEDEESFWRQQFDSLKAQQFPTLPVATYQPVVDNVIEHSIDNIQWPVGEITASTVIRAAWATLVSWQSASPDIVYGAVVLGRQAPICGIESLAGPAIATVPIRIIVDDDASVIQLLEEVQAQYTDMILYEQTGLQRIRRLAEEADRACQFQSLLVVQPAKVGRQSKVFKQGLDDEDDSHLYGDDFGGNGVSSFSTHALTLECQIDGPNLHLRIEFDSNVINYQDMTGISQRLGHIIHQLCRPELAATKIRDLSMASELDLRTIWEWNATCPPVIEACVHDLISERVREDPNAMAISAWDGELTYGELDELSTILAYELINIGVGVGTIVPLCFQKSVWVPVSEIAIMKAGGASVTMDTSQPEERLKSIVQQTGSTVIMSGIETSSLASSIFGKKALVVCNETLANIRANMAAASYKKPEFPVVKPSDLLYLVFTSGSTGVPKGAMITHSNFASASKHQRAGLGFKKSSRVADFASYAFDASWGNFLGTITAGGCLCIPSEEDRKHDFVGFMTRFKVNYVDLTPSVAAILDLHLVPGLEVVVLGGELIELDKFQHLKDIKSLLITYGPAECTVNATVVDVRQQDVPAASIGFGCGFTTWVVDPEKNVLMPVGAIGELVIEGPLVGLGYLNNSDKTAAAFIEDPAWLMQGGPGAIGRSGRLYRTGDLVRYHSDGSLIFIGRKDSQVKIRGQRVDLSDIEYHVRQLLPAEMTVQIVAEVVVPQGTKNPMLVLFFTISAVESIEAMKDVFFPILGDLERSLAKQLPIFMIPSAYVPIESIPISATGKTDRKALREQGALLDQRQMSSLSKSRSGEHIEPSNEVEKKLQLLWSSVLGLECSEISADDSFMRLGGDSISAMRLVAAARHSKISVSVAQILKYTQLNELAKVIEKQGDEQNEQEDEIIEPFSLLKADVNAEKARQDAAELCSVDIGEIEDVFPCTALQEGLIAMTARNAGHYVQRNLLELKPEVEIGRFKAAWETTFVAAPILRTRIVNLPGQGLVQVVVRTPIVWKQSTSVEKYKQEESDDEQNQRSMSLGAPLVTVGIIEEAADNKRYFAWTMHHATYDGWSLMLLQETFEQAYQQQKINALIPFQPFIKYVMNKRDENEITFWKTQFSGLDAAQFPVMPLKYQPQADKAIDQSIENIHWPEGDVTPASVLRATWATLLSWYGASADTVFGAVTIGRQAPVPQIEKLAAPTLATVPIRIVVDTDLSVGTFLKNVQSQATEMIPFEQTGLQNISRMSEDTQRGCQFQTLLVVQSAETSDNNTTQNAVFQGDKTEDDFDVFSTYAINITCEVNGSSLGVRINFDSKIIDTKQVQRLLQQFEHILRQLCQPVDTISHVKMADLSMASEQDVSTIWSWNATVPETGNGCVHQIFNQRVHENPSAQAICAWDGELTYRQLDDLSSQLAYHLIDAGVKPGIIVPMYFEKSFWVPVSVVAIMKAGGAGVTLDATLPVERLRGIVQQLSPVLMLNSAACEDLASEVTSTSTFTVNEASIKALQAKTLGVPFPEVDPDSPAYIVFTSGSTGLPKGAIVTHRNFCSSAKNHQEPLGLERNSRIYDFTSYAFDVAWSNMLHSITLGACLCIPSEEDRRSDIAGSITRLRANFVHITPTVANILDPMALPTVEKFLFTGEALKRGDVMRWKSRSDIKYYNTYGPAECTVTSSVEIVSPFDETEPSIGRAYGVLPWIVTPDGKSLTAVGTPGELWLEGPTVGGGYLNNPEKTAAAFVENPEWLLQGGGTGAPGRCGRLYRTGDIVRYNADGSLFYFGRKDTQVKIRGQRVELGEVDYNLRQLLPAEITQVVSAIITPQTTKIAILAVFFTVAGTLSAEELEEKTSPLIASLKENLVKRVPAYMVPTAYIPLTELPMTASGKTDRRALGELGKAYTEARVAELSENTFANSELTGEEASLRAIWADILNLDVATISPQHSFSALGGDSIRTMSLAIAIRKQWDLQIQVPRLLGPNDSLCEIAKLIKDLRQGQDVAEPATFDIHTELAALTNTLMSPLRMPSTVFLTGSTGFLGIQILQHVLKRQSFDRVVLLVRSTKGNDSLQRVRHAAKEAGWWDERFASAIEIWEGDLAAERLGLSNAQWSSLCGIESQTGVVDAIIHNGAAVHWSTDYEKLKAVNVGSTLQLLQAALHSKFMKKFVFVSGGMSSSDWEDPTVDTTAEATGYDRSKYLSEKLVSAAAEQRRDRSSMFSTVKPGLIIGDSEFGVANPDDFLWRVVTSAVKLQVRPTEVGKAWLSVSDVATISDIVLHHATADDVDHFVELQKGMWVDSFWAAIDKGLEQPLRSVSWETWMKLALEDMAKEQELHPLWPIQQFLGSLGDIPTTPIHDCPSATTQIEDAVRKNVKYLKDMGLLGVDGASWHQGVANVSMRSRRQD